ncbi:MAG: hypothetical protein E7626_01235 [Ruminococcaceae bacterium]|nr:hypothetical protein [Oscillospiraceae bacterium]
MRVTFTIPYPKTKAGRTEWNKRYGFNSYYSGKHWSERKKDAEYWHYIVRSELRRQLPKRTVLSSPVVITFYWNDNLDLSNHSCMAKMIEDALKGVIIEDDSRKHVKGIEHYFHGEDFIRVVVKEVESVENKA